MSCPCRRCEIGQTAEHTRADPWNEGESSRASSVSVTGRLAFAYSDSERLSAKLQAK